MSDGQTFGATRTMDRRDWVILAGLLIFPAMGFYSAIEKGNEAHRLKVENESLRREVMGLNARVMMYDYALKHPEEHLRPVIREVAR